MRSSLEKIVTKYDYTINNIIIEFPAGSRFQQKIRLKSLNMIIII